MAGLFRFDAGLYCYVQPKFYARNVNVEATIGNEKLVRTWEVGEIDREIAQNVNSLFYARTLYFTSLLKVFKNDSFFFFFTFLFKVIEFF